jgi:hypothetical protein
VSSGKVQKLSIPRNPFKVYRHAEHFDSLEVGAQKEP